MKRFLAIAILLFLLPSSLTFGRTGIKFADYFADRTMRIDYYHMGDKNREYIALDQIFRQGTWAGNPDHLIDEFDNGQYTIKVYDAASNRLIFSKGFNSYFGEYKTTDMAAKGRLRTYHESALIPYPKRVVTFAIERRDRSNRLKPIFSTEIDPAAVGINTGALTAGVKVFTPHKSGHPQRKVDIAFIAEGYQKSEEKKFVGHLDSAVQTLFGREPFKSRKGKFNIWGVFKPSQESGCDEPRRGIYKNTALDASFNALGLSRYLLTEGNRQMRDIAAHVPYDALVIMVNHTRYGGGGIYNSFCVFTADSAQKSYLLVHEFGHSFAGLADEYYSSGVVYNEFYPPGIEPTEPNITALLDTAALKWKELASPGLEIPTRWPKENYEQMAAAFQQTRQELNRKIEELVREGGSLEKMEKLKEQLEQLKKENTRLTDNFLANPLLAGKVGAFEGAGYSARGLYRPMLNCIMFTMGQKPFCKVCEAAIIRVINHYAE